MDIILSSLWMKGPGSLGHVQSHNVDPRQGRVWIKTLTRKVLRETIGHDIHRPKIGHIKFRHSGPFIGCGG